MRTSIQQRLFIILGLFVLANALLWSALALLLAYMVEDEIIDRVLASQTRQLLEVHATTGQLPAPSLRELHLYAGIDDAPLEIRSRISKEATKGELFTEDQTHYHYRWIYPPQQTPVLLVAEVSPWLVVTHISKVLLIFTLAGLAVATALGLFAVAMIARITTRPLRELANAIQAEPRPFPLPHVAKDDEVGVLASSMTSALDNLQQALAREQAFTRDVSHELRTPMTTLKNALQLMPRELNNSPHASELRDSSAELEHTLSTLLALARAESTNFESVQLRPLLEKLLVERANALQAGDFEVTLDVPDGYTVVGNPQVSRLLLGNLLDNALHYAEPAQLKVSLDGNSLYLENPQATEKRIPHDQSLRHGLALANRLAIAQNWRLETQMHGKWFLARLHWDE